jgi:hypothetical protein
MYMFRLMPWMGCSLSMMPLKQLWMYTRYISWLCSSFNIVVQFSEWGDLKSCSLQYILWWITRSINYHERMYTNLMLNASFDTPPNWSYLTWLLFPSYPGCKCYIWSAVPFGAWFLPNLPLLLPSNHYSGMKSFFAWFTMVVTWTFCFLPTENISLAWWAGCWWSH